MRCDEVTRELSVPTPGRDDLAISRHLTGCKTCSLWAEQAAEFDRLWDATRPAGPSAAAWDHLWSSITAQLDQPAATAVNGIRSPHAPVLPPTVSPAFSGSGRFWRGLAAVGIVGLAQAAALLIGIGLAWRGSGKSPSLPRAIDVPVIAQNHPPNLNSVIDVEEGEVPLIHLDGNKVRVDDLAAQDSSNGVDEYYLLLNVLEPMARSVVAMAE